MAFNCKADNSTTTTILPPTTTKTLPPATTTTETISTTTAYVETFDYEVCGNVTLKVDCSCSQNGYLYCTPSHDDYYYWSWMKNPPFRSTNLKIMNESFVVKQVKFYENALTTLQKDKVLPGNEGTVEIMNLESNNIHYIDNGTFDSFTALKELDLTNNYLTNVSGNILTKEFGLILQKLNLKQNLFTSITALDFSNLMELKDLSLYGNPNYIHENAFGYAYNKSSPPPLESFSVEYCNLSTIPEELLNWHNVKKIGLGGNPFICNCSMAWLINDLVSPTHSMNLQNIATTGYGSSDFQCSGPYGLKGISFAHLSKNFCPNEVKRECKEVKEKIVKELPSPFYISWFHICVGIALICFGIILGMTILPLFRLCCSRQKKEIIGFSNQNFPDDLVHEDFDEC
uniref:LRRCT domain-containing protein n=1 Tax=Panagrolaimus sp. PS1159 TaxID=55785 RepID=A0AC35FU40_9BILA